MPTRRPVPIGGIFDRLTVISSAPSIEYAKNRFLYRVTVKCRCGTQFQVQEHSLRDGNTTSCGCKRIEHQASGKANLRHGQCYSRTYRSWVAMKQRCNNPETKHYGTKGIKVCRRWQSFENFLADMGERPKGRSLDRIDGNGDYEPSNCRWATTLEQVANTSQAVILYIDDEPMTLTRAARAVGRHRSSVKSYAKYHGISLQEALDKYRS